MAELQTLLKPAENEGDQMQGVGLIKAFRQALQVWTHSFSWSRKASAYQSIQTSTACSSRLKMAFNREEPMIRPDINVSSCLPCFLLVQASFRSASQKPLST